MCTLARIPGLSNSCDMSILPHASFSSFLGSRPVLFCLGRIEVAGLRSESANYDLSVFVKEFSLSRGFQLSMAGQVPAIIAAFLRQLTNLSTMLSIQQNLYSIRGFIRAIYRLSFAFINTLRDGMENFQTAESTTG
jgi:hypothetical protein